MPLKNISPQRRRLSDEVYDQLIGAISRREIGPDDILVQEKLAAELGISRTPVREAMLRLEQEGVLAASNRGSYRLCQMSTDEVRELFQARAAIEGQAARILAAIITPEMAEELRVNIRHFESGTLDGAKDRFDANRAIHRAFVEAAGNRFLLDMFDMIWARAMAFHLFTAKEHSNLLKSPHDHLHLVDVLVSGDRTAALDAFSAHIQDGFDLQIEALARNTTTDGAPG